MRQTVMMSIRRDTSAILLLTPLIAGACHRAPTPNERQMNETARPSVTSPPPEPTVANPPVDPISTQHTREEFCRPWPAGVPCTYDGLRAELVRRITPESGLMGESGTCGAARYLAFGDPVNGTVAYFDARGVFLGGATWITATDPYNAKFGTPETCVHAHATSLAGAFPAGKNSFFPRFQTPAER